MVYLGVTWELPTYNSSVALNLNKHISNAAQQMGQDSWNHVSLETTVASSYLFFGGAL